MKNDQVNPDAANGVPKSTTESGGSGSTHCSPFFLRRLNKDGSVHLEIECEHDYGLFNPLSLKKSPLQIIGAYQAILGDAYEKGFDLNCHPEDLYLHIS